MDWNSAVQSINLDRLNSNQMELLSSTFERDLNNRIERLEQIDDQRQTDRDGKIRRFDGNWKIHDPSSVEVKRMNLSERVARLERFDCNENKDGRYVRRRHQHNWTIDHKTPSPSGMNLYDRIVRLEQILEQWEPVYYSRYYSRNERVRPIRTSPPTPSTLRTPALHNRIERKVTTYIPPTRTTTARSSWPFLVDSRTDYEKHSEFFKAFGFLPQRQQRYSQQETEALNRFFLSIDSCMNSMSVIAQKHKEVKAQNRVHRHALWDTLIGRKFTRAQSDEMGYLKLVFYELAKTTCRSIVIASVHDSQVQRIERLYNLIMNTELVDDHRSFLLSPSRLRETALKRALSERIIFTLRGNSPIGVKFVTLKTDKLVLNFVQSRNPHLFRAYFLQGYIGGYKCLNATLHQRLYDRYKDHIPAYFQ